MTPDSATSPKYTIRTMYMDLDAVRRGEIGAAPEPVGKRSIFAEAGMLPIRDAGAAQEQGEEEPQSKLLKEMLRAPKPAPPPQEPAKIIPAKKPEPPKLSEIITPASVPQRGAEATVAPKFKRPQVVPSGELAPEKKQIFDIFEKPLPEMKPQTGIPPKAQESAEMSKEGVIIPAVIPKPAQEIAPVKAAEVRPEQQPPATKGLPEYLMRMPEPPHPEAEEALRKQNLGVGEEIPRQAFGPPPPQMRLASPSAMREAATEPEKRHFAPAKKRTLNKIIIIALSVLVLASISVVGYYLITGKDLADLPVIKNVVDIFVKEEPAQEEPLPGKAQQPQTQETQEQEQQKEEIPAPAPPSAQIFVPIIQYHNEISLSLAEEDDILGAIKTIGEQGATPGSLMAVNVAKDGVPISAGYFFNNANVPMPDVVMNSAKNMNIVLYAEDFNAQRLGIIIEVEDAAAAIDGMINWESYSLWEPPNPPPVARLFLGAPYELLEDYPRFLENPYKNIYLKYMNFAQSNLSFDYAVHTDSANTTYLLIATSKEQMFAMIDALLLARR